MPLAPNPQAHCTPTAQKHKNGRSHRPALTPIPRSSRIATRRRPSSSFAPLISPLYLRTASALPPSLSPRLMRPRPLACPPPAHLHLRSTQPDNWSQPCTCPSPPPSSYAHTTAPFPPCCCPSRSSPPSRVHMSPLLELLALPSLARPGARASGRGEEAVRSMRSRTRRGKRRARGARAGRKRGRKRKWGKGKIRRRAS